MIRSSLFSLAALTLLTALAAPPSRAADTATTASSFVPFVLPWDDAAPGTTTDVSMLNAKPAGAGGFIVAKNGHFVESRTGERIRFLGVGFSFHENFPPHEDAERVAARLAKLGINLVRIHHHDDSNTMLWDKSIPGYTKFNPEAIDRLDYLIAQLKKRGIYVDLNLHVRRPYSPAAGFPASAARITTDVAKRIDNYDRQMIDFQKAFARAYLTRVNPYTGLAYTQDPCVALIEINNENSLVGWIATNDPSAELREQPEPFRGELVGLWNRWLIRKYRTTDALQTAWEGVALPPAETLEARSIDLPAQFPPPVRADWVRFLADTERAYADEMRRFLRDDLKVRVPITDTQIYYGGIAGIYRETGSDLADMHAYWHHPEFPHGGWSNTDWRIGNDCMATDLAKGADGGGGTLRKMALYRVAGMPYTVSEYNDTAPCDFQAECLPIVATYAAHQDWDMLCLFDYGNYGSEHTNDAYDPFFGIAENTAKAAFLPAAAMIFRSGTFAAAGGITTLRLTTAALLSGTDSDHVWKSASPDDALPDLLKTRLQIAVAPEANQSRIVTHAAPRPDTATTRIVTTPAGAQYLAVDARAQAAAGFVGGQTVALGPATFTFPTFGNDFAALTLTAMDGQVTPRSQRLLLTLMGKCENSGMVWNADRTTTIGGWGHGPVLAEAIPATVALHADAPRHIWALDTIGHRARPVPTSLPSKAIVEVPCLADRNGIFPCRMDAIPPQLAAVMTPHIAVHGMTVAGALRHDRRLIRQAIQADPMTAAVLTLPQIAALTEDMFRENRDYMAGW